jgi:membrane protease YdiL (CAAX protease family)
MLFLLKRTWYCALGGLVALTLLGLLLRLAAPNPLPLEMTLDDCAWGVVAVGYVLVSDVAIHGLLILWRRDEYRRLHRELAGLFRGQTFLAIVLGSLMAGAGEELVFRSLDPGPAYLFGSAVVFGLLHHVGRRLRLFTLWAVWQGVLFAVVMLIAQRIGVTMAAHFLHDLVGFCAFRFVYNRGEVPPAP